jgi:hypothetical protein
MKKIKSFCALAVMIAAALSPAYGATIVRNVEFSAENFTAGVGQTLSPYSSVQGYFTIALDDSSSVLTTTSIGLSNVMLNIPLDGPLTYIWNHDALDGFLIVGGFANGANQIDGTFSNDVLLLIFGFLTDAPLAGAVIYSSTLAPVNSFRSQDPAQLAFSAVQSAVPEPYTWTMLIFGFGLVGILRRRNALSQLEVS